MRNGLILDRWTVGPRAAQIDPKGLDGVAERILNGRRLKTTMEHAVGTLGISAISVILPHRLFHQGLETRGIAFLRQQIARPLPAKDIPRWVPPGGARVGLVSRQKVEE